MFELFDGRHAAPDAVRTNARRLLNRVRVSGQHLGDEMDALDRAVPEGCSGASRTRAGAGRTRPRAVVRLTA